VELARTGIEFECIIIIINMLLLLIVSVFFFLKNVIEF